MALGNCRECGKQVSTEAKACPHCGVKVPIRKQRRWLWMLGGLFLLGLLVRPMPKVSPDPAVSSNTVTLATQVKSQPTKVTRPECLVRKANGLLDERECDLVELCKDRAFFIKRLAKNQLENKPASAVETQGELNKNAKWIADYAPQDVQNICSENYAPYQTTKPNMGVVAREAPITSGGECSRSPLEIFNVGERFQSPKLSNLTDRLCPQAKWLPNESIEVSYAGKAYVVQTKKLPFDGVATYEIVSVKAGANSTNASLASSPTTSDNRGTRQAKRLEAMAILERLRQEGQACERALKGGETKLEVCLPFGTAMGPSGDWNRATHVISTFAGDAHEHGETLDDYEKMKIVMTEISGYSSSLKRWIAAP